MTRPPGSSAAATTSEDLRRFGELESGKTLTLVNDHEPTPLYHQMNAEVEAFDAEGYTVDRVSSNEFVTTLPKK